MKAIGCEEEPKVISEKDQVRKVEYPSKMNGPSLTVLYLEGHGHHWSGFKSSLPDQYVGPYSTKLNATDVLWDFFQKHSQAVLPQKPERKSDNGERHSLNWTTPAIKAERAHETMPLLKGLGEANWNFYRTAFGKK